MADYYQLKNQNIFNPPANTSLGNASNQFDDVYVQNDLVLGNTTVTGATIVTPKVSTIDYPGDDTAADPAGGQTITLTGSGFLVGASVLINGSAVGVVSVVSSTTITFTSPANSAGSYVLYVINTDGGTAIAIPGIQYSGVPTWTTAAGSLGTVYETQNINSTVTATGDAPITYSLFSGSIPPGATFNSNGTITGTSQLLSSSTTYTFTVRATDAEAQDTNRSFSLTISPDVVTWSSPANGTTYTSNVNSAISNVVLSATSAVGSGITYIANALPTGLSLIGANISGTPTVEANSSSLLTATANTTSELSSITINWVISVANDAFFEYNTLLIPGASTTFVDDASTNNFAVTINGDTKPNSFNPYTPGYYSNYFDGTGDYLSASSATAFNMGTDNFTIEGWVYMTVYSSACLFGTTNGSTTGYYVNLGADLNTFRVVSNASGTWADIITASAGNGIPLNQWVHVAFVRNGANITLYKNGISVATSSGASAYNFTSPSNAGYVGFVTNGVSTQYFTGYISNVRVVKGTAVYTSTFTPSTTPLTAIANTSLLTCQSNRFIDNSTNNFTITVNGNTLISSFDPFVPNSSYATYGSGYFDGSSSNLSIPDNAAFEMGSGDYTVEFWFFAQSNSDGGLIFKGYYYTDGSWAQGFGVRRVSGTNLRFYFNTTGSNTTEKYYDYTSTTLLNTWYHVAMTVSSGVGYAFLNGTLLNPGGFASVGAITNSSIGLTIGAFPFESGYRYFNGYITDVRVVKGTAVYTTTFTPPSTPLTAISNTSLLTLQNNQSVNNNVFLDNSTNNFFVTRNGNTTQGTFSPYGGNWSNYFDGTGDMLQTPSITIGTNAFCFECWLYPTVTQGTTTGIFVGSTTDSLQASYYGNPGLGIATKGTAWQLYEETTLPTVNAWNHVAFVRSGTGANQTSIYINGVRVANGTVASNFAASVYQISTTNAGGSVFQGYISNARLTNGSTPYDATQSTITVPTTPLTPITNTSLLTCQSNRLIDNSVNNFTITKNGDVSVQRFSPFNPSVVTPTSYSGYFDGTGDYLTWSGTTVGTGAMTFECWFYYTGSFSGISSFIGPGSAITGGLNCYINDSTSFAFDAYGVTAKYFTVPTITANTWNHVAFVRNSSNLATVFFNGVRSSTGTVSDTYSYTTSAAIGYTGGVVPRNWIGYITNARLVVGSNVYDPTSTTITVPTTPLTAIANTSLLTCQSPTFIDNSTNNFAITAFGNSQPTIQNPFGFTSATTNGYTVSTIGGSGYFDGSDYLVPSAIANTAMQAIANSLITIEFWVYTTAIQAVTAYSTSVFGQFLSAAINGRYIVSLAASSTVSPQQVSFGWTTSPSASEGVTSNINLNQDSWNHVAITIDSTTPASSTLTIYSNGVGQIFTGKNLSSQTVDNGSPFYIGGDYGSNNQFLNGYLSDFRFVRGQLVYKSNFVPPSQPLTAVTNTTFLLNMTSAGIYDAAMMNNMETVGNAQLSTAISKFGGSSMSFDGTGDYLKAPFNPAYSLPGDFTVETWIYLTSAAGTGNQTIASFGYNNSTGAGPWGFYLNGNGPYTLYFNSTPGNKASTTTVAIPINTWTHVTYCRSGSTGRFFVNGTIVGTAIADAFTYSGTTESLFVGIMSDASSAPLYGYLDDLRITKGIARYTSNFTPATSAFPIF